MRSHTIRILIGDDHPLVREGLATILSTQPDMVVVAQAETGRQTVEQFRLHRPDVAFIDLRMPEMSGFEAMEEIRKEFPDARMIALTSFQGDEDIAGALKAGACSYMLKNAAGGELVQAVRTVNGGSRYLPHSITDRLADRMGGPGLTERELEILKLIVNGKSNDQIAEVLGIGEGTVKWHVKNILSKLEVNSRTQAATTALQRGIVHLD